MHHACLGSLVKPMAVCLVLSGIFVIISFIGHFSLLVRNPPSLFDKIRTCKVSWGNTKYLYKKGHMSPQENHVFFWKRVKSSECSLGSNQVPIGGGGLGHQHDGSPLCTSLPINKETDVIHCPCVAYVLCCLLCACLLAMRCPIVCYMHC